MTDLLDCAVAHTHLLPPEMQDETARRLLPYAWNTEPVIQLTPVEADFAEAEAEAERGGSTTGEEMRAIFVRHRARPSTAAHRPPMRYGRLMDRDQILERLRDHAPDLRHQGVVRAALFGSTARGEARPDSDIDIMVELDPEVVRTLFDYVGVKLSIEDLFETAVDVVDRRGLKPHVRPHVMADAIYAF